VSHCVQGNTFVWVPTPHTLALYSYLQIISLIKLMTHLPKMNNTAEAA